MIFFYSDFFSLYMNKIEVEESKKMGIFDICNIDTRENENNNENNNDYGDEDLKNYLYIRKHKLYENTNHFR